MTRNKLSRARQLAAAVVLGNLASIVLLGVVLPQPALVLLPVVALLLPLLSAAGIEEVLSRAPSDAAKRPAARPSASQLGQPLHQAA